jgi:uncharacterized protein
MGECVRSALQRYEIPPTDWVKRIEEQVGKDTGLMKKIVQRFLLELEGIHGVDHWLRVYVNGVRLAQLTGADARVVKWFALMHDSCRRFDGSDREHGPRAAAFAREHREEIDLDDAAFGLLESAIACHTVGCSPTADITVRTCLDADRLDIERVGLRINPRLLYTEAAKTEARRRHGA